MYRAVMLFLALTFSPAVVAAQEPCTTDARRVVDQLYRHILERAPDAGGANWAQQQLQTGQMTVRDVVAQLAKSEEHSQRFWRQEAGEDAPYSRAIGTLYRHLLGRQPDAAGARSWANEGARSGVSAIVDQFVTSPEYDKQFGDWGLPGHSGGLTYCAPGNRSVSQPQVVPDPGRFAGMDRNADGIISRAEWRGNNQSFQNQDWNNDGVLSGDEVDGGAARFGRTAVDKPTAVDPREARRAERFTSLDRNGNGRIESREWDGTVAVFNRLDVNNDNFLSRAEMINNTGVEDTAATGTPAQVRAFNSMDANTNGRIELREWNGTATAFNRLDVNNDNILSRAEMINAGVEGTPATGTSAQVRAERAFNLLDVNTNGRIELREWNGTAAEFNRLDVNNDNIVSRVEMINVGVEATTATGTSAQVRAERAFNLLDVNTNGRIELREWNGTAAEFDRLDVNNDNVLSRAEMINVGVDEIAATGTSGQALRVQRFNSMDVNSNGRIELREWTGTAAAFDRLDVNNDNVLSRVEIEQ